MGVARAAACRSHTYTTSARPAWPFPPPGGHRHERIRGVRFPRLGAARRARAARRSRSVATVEPVHERDPDLGWQPEPTRDHPQIVDPVLHRPHPVLLGVQLVAIHRARAPPAAPTPADPPSPSSPPPPTARSPSPAPPARPARSPEPAPTTPAPTPAPHSSPDTPPPRSPSPTRPAPAPGVEPDVPRHPLHITPVTRHRPRRSPHPRRRARLRRHARAPPRSPRSPRPTTDRLRTRARRDPQLGSRPHANRATTLLQRHRHLEGRSSPPDPRGVPPPYTNVCSGINSQFRSASAVPAQLLGRRQERAVDDSTARLLTGRRRSPRVPVASLST